MNAPWMLRNLIGDTLVNFVTGFGTDRDKLAHSQYALTLFTQTQLDAAYRTDWVARKVVDLPAQDATREWRTWQASDDQIELIEAVEKKHDVSNKVRRALIRSRLYGGGGLIPGVDGTGGFETELDLERVGKDSLKFLHTVGRYEVQTEALEQDLMSPWYGHPKFYGFSTPGGAQIRVHPSRFIRFIGQELPDQRNSTDGWGDSVVQIVNDAIMASGTVAVSIANLVTESHVDILKIPGFSENLGTAEYESRLNQRVALAKQLKGILRTTVIDTEEELNRISASFASLPELMETYLMMASGAADIPAVRMLGQSPRGLNATGESDIRNYYDRIASDRAMNIEPPLSVLDEIIIRSALGSRPPEVYYTWVPLWQQTPAEKADLAKKSAEAFQIEVNMGLINPDVLREVRINQLTELGVYPGIEDAVEEFGAEPEEPEVDENAIAALVQQQQAAAKTRGILPKREDFEPKPKLKAVGDEWDPSKHPRHPAGRSEGGEFASAGAGYSDPEHDIEGTDKRAWPGVVIEVSKALSKQQTGNLAEDLALAWAKRHLDPNARILGLRKHEKAADLFANNTLYEIKGGHAGNKKGAHKWRLTQGEPGKAEKAWRETASEADKAELGREKQGSIRTRKEQLRRRLSKELGVKIGRGTITTIINPDTRTADVYHLKGWHDYIGWNSPLAKTGYRGSVKYAKAKKRR